MTDSPFYRARAWAIRDKETGERLTYRYHNRADLPALSRFDHTGRVVEIYATSMNRPLACHPRRAKARLI